MTDPSAEYVRVNVSSATSPSRYNQFGEKIAEVEMELPANLVNNAGSVGRANMALMKMFLPMAAIPQNSVQIEVPLESSVPLQVELTSNLRVGFAPGNFSADTGEFRLNPLHAFFQLNPMLQMTPLCFTARHGTRGQPIEYAKLERDAHEHELRTLNELIVSLNNALRTNLEDNQAEPDDPEKFAPQIWFEILSDNSIQINVLPIGSRPVLPPSNPDIVRSIHPIEYMTHYQLHPGRTDVAYIAANEQLANLFPSLPWLKTTVHGGGEFPEPCYLLDTTQANVSIQHNYCTIVRDPGDQEKMSCDKISFHFPASDVMTLTNISSFIVTMNGVCFNQQVYPVNFSPVTAAAAQTGVVPILEVFYPVLSSPSEFTTDLIVIKDDFSNAAPVKINPSLLRERSIKFKVWCVLKDGRMKEVVIPSTSVLSFQVCFELYPLQ